MNKPEILERCVQYSLRIIKLFKHLEKDSAGRIIWKQLLRCGTSIGANVHEAQGGQSKADLIFEYLCQSLNYELNRSKSFLACISRFICSLNLFTL